MRKKFKIFYCKNHPDPSLAGTQYKPKGKNMLVMNNQGIFFEYCGDTYYPGISKLSDKIGNYDVVWSDDTD